MKHSKKLIALLIGAVVLLSGCIPSQPSVQQSTPAPEQITTTTTTAVPALPDALLVSTDLYEIRRLDGKCYLSFHAGNVQKEEEGCILYWPWIYFKSMQELYEGLVNGSLDEGALESIQHHFTLEEGKGFVIQDPERLYTLQTPEDVKVREYKIEGLHCSYALATKNGGDGLGNLYIKTEEEYQSGMEFYLDFETGAREYNTRSKHGPTGGDAYDYDTPAGPRRMVLYRGKTENGNVFVALNYKLNYKEETLVEVHVYGQTDGVYYSMNLHGLKTSPSIAWLADFRFSRFVPA